MVAWASTMNRFSEARVMFTSQSRPPAYKPLIVRSQSELVVFCCRLHQDEGGQLSILSLVVILGMILSLATVTNVAMVMKQKLETQNAADGVTQAATTHMARGMNSITAANHLIGELQALVVLHHALGGDALDRGNGRDLTPGDVSQSVNNTHQLAQSWTAGAPQYLRPLQLHYNALRKSIVVEAAIGDSRVELKKVMSYAYVAQAVGGMIYQLRYTPYIGQGAAALGITIMTCATIDEWKVYTEWMILDGVELLAKTPLSTIKKSMQEYFIPGVYTYSRLQTGATPLRAEAAAIEVGKYHLAEGSLFPGLKKNFSLPLLLLPVEPEPEQMTDRELEKSQLVRASVPWVHHWRLPILSFADRALQLARFRSYYVKYTQEMSLSMARRAKQNQHLNLLIITGLADVQMNKNREEWTKSEGSRKADKLFCIMGFAHRSEPDTTAPSFFEDVNRDGVTCFAQGMMYNANPQRGNVAAADRQAEVGWDTLNWLGTEIPEWRRGEDPNPKGHTTVAYFSARAREPVIQLNWQCMLVPSTRISESVIWQRGASGRLLRRTTVNRPIARTH